jgi:hypothetical protein
MPLQKNACRVKPAALKMAGKGCFVEAIQTGKIN